MVTIQAIAISPPTPQRTMLTRSAEPTPMMAELTTWVVLTGPPTRDAPRITKAEVTYPQTNCFTERFNRTVLDKFF
jgi:transposase